MEDASPQRRGDYPARFCMPARMCASKVNIVGSQDTTGLMTAQELEAMAATVIRHTGRRRLSVRLCHTAFRLGQERSGISKPFMNNFGVITAA